MPSRCAVADCHRQRGGHVYPSEEKSPQRRKAWINLSKRLDDKGRIWKPAKHDVVCSIHFKTSDFFEKLPHQKNYRLKPGVIPSIFPARGKVQTASQQWRSDKMSEKETTPLRKLLKPESIPSVFPPRKLTPQAVDRKTQAKTKRGLDRFTDGVSTRLHELEKYQCASCYTTNSSFSTLKRHKEMYPNCYKIHRCELCSILLRTEASWKTHMRKHVIQQCKKKPENILKYLTSLENEIDLDFFS